MTDIFYSPDTDAFYDPELGGQIPDDAVAITPARHRQLIAARAEGRTLMIGPNGTPVLAPLQPPPPPSEAVLAAEARGERDRRIQEVAWMIDRHRDQMDLGGPTTLDAGQFTRLLVYVEALRDLPGQAGFPTSIDWPEHPSGPIDDEADL